MKSARESLWRVLEILGYSIHRWPVNRFDGMRDALRLLRQASYLPRVIIDGGANMGTWTGMARVIFPDSAFHMIELQPACSRALEDLVRDSNGFVYRPVALTEPGVAHVRLIGCGEGGGGTGAWIATHGERAADEVRVPSRYPRCLAGRPVTRDSSSSMSKDTSCRFCAAEADSSRSWKWC